MEMVVKIAHQFRRVGCKRGILCCAHSVRCGCTRLEREWSFSKDHLIVLLVLGALKSCGCDHAGGEHAPPKFGKRSLQQALAHRWLCVLGAFESQIVE